METTETAGQKLIADLSQPSDTYRLTVLIIEAGRIAERLEKLDAILCGDTDTWARLLENKDGDLDVFVDGALSEARQQAIVLRQLLAEIQRQRAATPEAPTEDDLAGLTG